MTDPRGAWKGLAVEAFLARHALENDDRPLTNTRAWTVLGDVAALAETLAVGKRDLLGRTGSGADPSGRAGAMFASLAVEAREVARLAAVGASTHERAVPGTANARGVITVPSTSRLPDAVENLPRILNLEDASAPDLLAVSRVLAQTSRATAAVLTAAAAAPQAEISAHLTATATALLEHSDRRAPPTTGHLTLLALPPDPPSGTRFSRTPAHACSSGSPAPAAAPPSTGHPSHPRGPTNPRRTTTSAPSATT